MNIIVCIKQVPDTTQVQIDPVTNTLKREGVQSIINPFDTYAIEEGVRLKEKFNGKVTVITMGPPQAENALREAISLGCDEGILISDRAFAGSDTLATSYTLSQAIKKIGAFDIIICGKQASDGDTAQVGPGIATHLDLPQVTYVKKIENIKDKEATIERMTEEGFEIVVTSLPCLITVVKEINEPRIPSLKGKMKAKSAQIQTWKSIDLDVSEERLGLTGSPTWVNKIFTPPPRPKGQILEGEAAACVDKMVNILKSHINTLTILFILFFSVSSFAQTGYLEGPLDKKETKEVDEFMGYYNTAFDASDNGNLDKALEYYLKAYSIYPKDYQTNLGIGTVYYEKGNYEEALPYLKKASEIYPSKLAPYIAIGVTARSAGKNDISLDFLTKGYEIHPDEPAICSELSKTYTILQEFDNALFYAKKALEINQTKEIINGVNYLDLGIIYFQTNKMDDASQALEKAIEFFEKEGKENYLKIAQDLLKKI
ncbi:MAG: tetratricopeptide repeat protein [Candidatus Omnitrophica bacterium]|nr:tetratricopeptide repeat protein [Candidatus Omnitrophota bacterium]